MPTSELIEFNRESVFFEQLPHLFSGAKGHHGVALAVGDQNRRRHLAGARDIRDRIEQRITREEHHSIRRRLRHDRNIESQHRPLRMPCENNGLGRELITEPRDQPNHRLPRKGKLSRVARLRQGRRISRIGPWPIIFAKLPPHCTTPSCVPTRCGRKNQSRSVVQERARPSKMISTIASVAMKENNETPTLLTFRHPRLDPKVERCPCRLFRERRDNRRIFVSSVTS